MKIYVFGIYLGLEHNDLVEIKVKAKGYNEAVSKAKMILHNHIDINVTGLFLNDSYDD